MTLLDRFRRAGRHLHQGTENMAAYARQLLRGNRDPHAASQAAPRSGGARAGAADRRPVLLLQGYLANRGSVQLLARRLHDRGHVVVTYKLGSMNVADIRSTAALVAGRVESLARQSGVDRVDVVGHSMGGLIALYYVKRLGGERRVRRLVLLGAPVAGTWSAALGLLTLPLGAASRQLLPDSEFLRELHAGPMPPGIELVTITGERDLFAPLRRDLLAGARHILLPTTHAGLLVEAEAADAVDQALSAPTPGFVDGAAPAPYDASD